jgi:hypothetical protein
VRGFGAEIAVGGLVAVFALATVLLVIVAIPQLAPVAQAFMTATLIRVGVAAGPAVAATLAFRGRMLFLPLLLGVPCAWRMGRFGGQWRAACCPREQEVPDGNARTLEGSADRDSRRRRF